LSILARLHRNLVSPRRVKVLSELISNLLPTDSTVLDVGCGDGTIDRLIAKRRPDLTIRGIDVFVRPDAVIPVELFDGATIPYGEGGVDVVMFVDVLHHTTDPESLLAEGIRVARRALVIKDHTREGLLSDATLRFMDWVGNSPHGVTLSYNYWRQQRWHATFERLGLTPSTWLDRLDLYPAPARWFFDRRLHFIAHFDLCRGPAVRG
jgi:SAM-dependent methyltransferase